MSDAPEAQAALARAWDEAEAAAAGKPSQWATERAYEERIIFMAERFIVAHDAAERLWRAGFTIVRV